MFEISGSGKLVRVLWETFKTAVPLGLSSAALWAALKDRRAPLYLRERTGKWFVLIQVMNGDIIVDGTMEIYNPSSRANTVRSYEFSCRDDQGRWSGMECEKYETVMTAPGKTLDIEHKNTTPLTLPPHSGTEVSVMAITKLSHRPDQLVVRVRVEDLFGRNVELEVTAVW